MTALREDEGMTFMPVDEALDQMYLLDKAETMSVPVPVEIPTEDLGYGFKDSNPRFPVVCPECNKHLMWTSINAHLVQQHDYKGPTLKFADFVKIRFFGEFIPQRKVRGPSKKTTEAQRIKDAERKRAERAAKGFKLGESKEKLPPLDAQLVVEKVLIALYPNGIPVKFRHAVRHWEQATEQLIKETGL